MTHRINGVYATLKLKKETHSEAVTSTHKCLKVAAEYRVCYFIADKLNLQG